MNFNKTLISGEFIKRYKRFFVDIKIDKNTITAHCPNTGSMMGLLKEGNNVWLSKSNNPKRKLKYTLQIIKSGSAKVGVNTHLTNKIVPTSLAGTRAFLDMSNSRVCIFESGIFVWSWMAKHRGKN